MLEVKKKDEGKYLEIAEALLNGLKEINDKQDVMEKRIDNLENIAEIDTTERYIIKDLVKRIVYKNLKNKSRSHLSVAYSKVYRDMRRYGLAQPLGFTQKKDYDRIVKALNSYVLDVDFVEERVKEILREQ